jgi:hypothetical protein
MFGVIKYGISIRSSDYATGCMIRGLNPGRDEIFLNSPD